MCCVSPAIITDDRHTIYLIYVTCVTYNSTKIHEDHTLYSSHVIMPIILSNYIDTFLSLW